MSEEKLYLPIWGNWFTKDELYEFFKQIVDIGSQLYNGSEFEGSDSNSECGMRAFEFLLGIPNDEKMNSRLDKFTSGWTDGSLRVCRDEVDSKEAVWNACKYLLSDEYKKEVK